MKTSLKTGPSPAMPDEFDRLLGQLDGLTGVSHTLPHTLATMSPLGVGGSTTFIVQTYRQREEPAEPGERPARNRDSVFLIIASPSGFYRHVIPQEVVDTLIRQRDTLERKARKAAGRLQADRLRAMTAERKARGEPPAFLKRRGTRKRKRSRA